MTGPHDIGGKNFGSVKHAEKSKSNLDTRIDILQRLLGGAGVRAYRVDELRRSIESMPSKAYYSLGYYHRWLYAIHQLLIEKEILSAKEIDNKVSDLKKRKL